MLAKRKIVNNLSEIRMIINKFVSLQKEYTITNILTKNCDMPRKRSVFIASLLLKIGTVRPEFVQKSACKDGFGT